MKYISADHKKIEIENNIVTKKEKLVLLIFPIIS